jgi:hypothetical protein
MARDTVAGYFSSGEDAHRAINELMQEGFSATEIGAAFHSGTSGRRSSGATAEADENVNIPPAGRADSTSGGAASGTERVFPWGLQTGGGTVFAGASQPGPIPGSELPSDLPRDIPSELASDSGNRASSTPRTTSAAESTSGKRESASEKEALNYGTGEGHLPLSSNYNYPYSGSAFESSFSGMGIPQEHSRRLSRDLRGGGAVVTVRAGSRNATAEAVMQRNNGVIRYESAPATGEAAWESGAQEPRVDVFGEMHRVYPGYVPGEDVRSRKAS